MAITASGLYVQTFVDVLDTTQTAINLSLATHKFALVSDTYTPNFDTHLTFANLTNEVTGTNWAAGGVPLSTAAAGSSTTPTVTISPAGTLMYDMQDVSVANTTVTNAMAAVLYADALTDELIVLVDFITAISTVAGTLGIQWSATGVFTLDLA